MNTIEKDKYDNLLKKFNQNRSKYEQLLEMNFHLQRQNAELQKIIDALKAKQNVIPSSNRIKNSDAEMPQLPQVSPNGLYSNTLRSKWKLD